MSQLHEMLEKHTSLYVEAFNAGDFDAVDGFYTEEAVAVWEPGRPLTGQARRDYQREFLARRPKMTATPRQSFVTSDTALMIVDWVIETVDDAGEPERLEGVGVDVLRLGEDGIWRYAVDDPYGQD
ncbi:nuclear transport factor 2 family protein [Streptomyces sp. TRM64462]|uniref:YybH family protein n=1 Tax=Streptomyces sp. TRM64462 TaxID=2741726 RepID=UPI0015864FE3|nr:nuclear transport factor 2 family protein [Streptomyces sp. TRM64462]